MLFTRFTRLLVCALALIVLPVSAADAAAKAKKKKSKVLPARSLAVKGTVIGTPYTVGSRVFVPVLLQSASVSKAKLSAAQGLLSVPRTMEAIPPKGAKVQVTHLRTGDGFTANTRVTNAIRKSRAPQLSVTKLFLPRRGLKLSAAEIEDKLKVLESGLRTLAVYTVGQITDLRAQIAAHTGRLTTLTQQIAALQAQLAALPADQTAAIAALQSQIAALTSQIAALQAQLAALPADQTAAIAALNSQIAALTTRTATLEGQLAALQASNAATNAAVAALTTRIATLEGQTAGITSTVSGLQGQAATLASRVQFLCSGNIVTGNPALGILNLTNIGACPS